MNLAESMKHVLKTRGQGLFSDFWKQDLKLVVSDLKRDFVSMSKNSVQKIRSLKDQSVKETLSEIRESATDTIVIFRVVPRRIRDGFTFFQEDVLKELEKIPEPKQRAVFGLKVMGALGGSTLSAFYGMKKARSQVSFGGLRIRNAFTHYIITELIFKVTQVFVLRFLSEVEKELSNEQDKKNVKFFRDLLSDDTRLDHPELLAESSPEPGDKALEIVETLKNYIITGKRAG